jgi:(p)ppGpp synthase/HD superfamily hydrolase
MKERGTTPTLEDAISLAVESHRGQPAKDAYPYILHPMRVMLRLETESERIVGVLHDVVEDTKGKPNQITLDDLRRMGYSEEVVQAMDCVTKREGETYEQFIARSKTNSIAKRVKLADLEDNMDIRRLPEQLTEKDLKRLAKYRRAWEQVKG